MKHSQKTSGEPSFRELRKLVLSSLEDFKALDIQEIDVSAQNSLTDLFVLASGNSSRHVQSMAENLVIKAKAAGCQPLGIEGEKEGEWVLVDLNDIIVHLMQPKTRAFYNLEKLWEAGSNRRSSAATQS
ncbi:MAG TPA: ribosome silencing factor [Xanthomonadales bacterium]|nr:ribosome silencing factor [Xanthomonadales bacterium]